MRARVSPFGVAQKYMDAWNRPDPAGIVVTFAGCDAHKEAMDRFFGLDFAAAAITMICVPDRLNPMCVRCTECGQMTDYDHGQGTCRCGLPPPERPLYW